MRAAAATAVVAFIHKISAIIIRMEAEHQLRLLSGFDNDQIKSHISPIHPASHSLIYGDSATALAQFPNESIDLVVTSPPYYNARPDYAEYDNYDIYLDSISNVLAECHRLLKEGRFLAINTSTILIERECRQSSSQRLAIPFDLHPRICQLGFDFIDDIVWVKPAGAGLSSSRCQRFAADRNPLQYMTAPITEYVMIYRKSSEQFINWNIASEPENAVQDSKVGDDYEATNVWMISPASSPDHPAIFPVGLADRLITYYSFVGDTILDPYAGSGTTLQSCVNLGRAFMVCELKSDYIDLIKERCLRVIGTQATHVKCFNTSNIISDRLL